MIVLISILGKAICRCSACQHKKTHVRRTSNPLTMEENVIARIMKEFVSAILRGRLTAAVKMDFYSQVHAQLQQHADPEQNALNQFITGFRHNMEALMASLLPNGLRDAIRPGNMFFQHANALIVGLLHVKNAIARFEDRELKPLLGGTSSLREFAILLFRQRFNVPADVFPFRFESWLTHLGLAREEFDFKFRCDLASSMKEHTIPWLFPSGHRLVWTVLPEKENKRVAFDDSFFGKKLPNEIVDMIFESTDEFCVEHLE